MSGHRVRSIAAAAFAVALAACSDIQAPHPPRPRVVVLEPITPTAITVAAGSPLEGAAVRLTGDGVPMRGDTVWMTLQTSTGTELGVRAVLTDSDGIANARAWQPTEVGEYVLRAHARGVHEGVRFNVGVREVGRLEFLRADSGDLQAAFEFETLRQPLYVRATDAFHNPVAGVPVVFSAQAGSGTIASDVVMSDERGYAASGLWTLGPAGELQQVVARAGTLEARFLAVSLRRLRCDPYEACEELAFVRNDSLFLRDAAGADRLIAPNAATPAWSPDGERLAFSIPGTDSPWRLCIVSVDGEGSCAGGSFDGALAGPPSWSPDGRRLVFSVAGASLSDVLVLNTATMQVATLSTVKTRSLSWTPHGQTITFVSVQDGEWGEISDDGRREGTTWLSNRCWCGGKEIAWSRDGQQVAVLEWWWSSGIWDFETYDGLTVI